MISHAPIITHAGAAEARRRLYPPKHAPDASRPARHDKDGGADALHKGRVSAPYCPQPALLPAEEAENRCARHGVARNLPEGARDLRGECLTIFPQWDKLDNNF